MVREPRAPARSALIRHLIALPLLDSPSLQLTSGCFPHLARAPGPDAGGSVEPPVPLADFLAERGVGQVFIATLPQRVGSETTFFPKELQIRPYS